MLGPIGLVILAATLIATHWKLVKEVLGDVWHFLDNEVVHPMERGFDWLRTEIESHLTEIEHYAKEFGPALLVMLGPIGLIAGAAIELVTHWKTVSRTFDEVVTDVKRGWDRLEHDVLGLWHTVGTDTDKGVRDVVDFVEGLPRDVEHLFADADTRLLDAGEDVLKGLIKGLVDQEKDVLKTAEDIGKHVLHDLTHPWSILSPSKKAAEAGGYLVQGISVGMKQELPGLLTDVDHISRSVVSELGKMRGQDLGHSFMVEFARGISDNRQLVQSALKNAFTTVMVTPYGAGGSAHPIGPGSSVTYQYNMSNTHIEANDPGQMGRKLDLVARRKNVVRT
jgi:hypothetical protein